MVRLSWEDLTYAAHVGVRRRVESLEGKFEPRNGAPKFSPTLWSQDIDGAAAELAVALYLDQPWTGERSRAHCDVGQDIQVRHTWYLAGCLIVREDDRPGRYVLVVGHDGSYDLMGWRDCFAAKQPEWEQQDGNKYWMVPSDRLRRMEELRDLVAA